MTLHEGERLAYLQALGITQYVPLHPVDRALQLPVWVEIEEAAADVAVEPSPDVPLDMQPEQTTVAAETTTVSEEPATTNVAESVSRVVETLSSDIPKLDLSRVKLEDDIRSTPVAKKIPLQRFTLGVLSLPNGLRLLVELGQPDAPGLSAIEFRMLSDLKLALNLREDISESSLKLFRWPLVKNPRIAADVSGARDALLAFLAAAQAEQKAAKLLFLGTTSLQCFHQQKIGTAFTVAELNQLPCLYTHSLAALQNDWRLKAETWHHILGLI